MANIIALLWLGLVQAIKKGGLIPAGRPHSIITGAEIDVYQFGESTTEYDGPNGGPLGPSNDSR